MPHLEAIYFADNGFPKLATVTVLTMPLLLISAIWQAISQN